MGSAPTASLRAAPSANRRGRPRANNQAAEEDLSWGQGTCLQRIWSAFKFTSNEVSIKARQELSKLEQEGFQPPLAFEVESTLEAPSKKKPSDYTALDLRGSELIWKLVDPENDDEENFVGNRVIAWTVKDAVHAVAVIEENIINGDCNEKQDELERFLLKCAGFQYFTRLDMELEHDGQEKDLGVTIYGLEGAWDCVRALTDFICILGSRCPEAMVLAVSCDKLGMFPAKAGALEVLATYKRATLEGFNLDNDQEKDIRKGKGGNFEFIDCRFTPSLGENLFSKKLHHKSITFRGQGAFPRLEFICAAADEGWLNDCQIHLKANSKVDPSDEDYLDKIRKGEYHGIVAHPGVRVQGK